VFQHPVRKGEAIPKAEFIVKEHRGKSSTNEVFEHSWLLADKALVDQSRINTLIDRDVGKDLASHRASTADFFGVMLNVIIVGY
jgi:hypothetical protein